MTVDWAFELLLSQQELDKPLEEYSRVIIPFLNAAGCLSFIAAIVNEHLTTNARMAIEEIPFYLSAQNLLQHGNGNTKAIILQPCYRNELENNPPKILPLKLHVHSTTLDRTWSVDGLFDNIRLIEDVIEKYNIVLPRKLMLHIGPKTQITFVLNDFNASEYVVALVCLCEAKRPFCDFGYIFLRRAKNDRSEVQNLIERTDVMMLRRSLFHSAKFIDGKTPFIQYIDYNLNSKEGGIVEIYSPNIFLKKRDHTLRFGADDLEDERLRKELQKSLNVCTESTKLPDHESKSINEILAIIQSDIRTHCSLELYLRYYIIEDMHQ